MVAILHILSSGLFDDAGTIQNPGSYNTAAARLLDDLVWWSHALNAAREGV